MNFQKAVVFLVYFVLKYSECAKILGVFPLAGRSINILTNKIMVTLANAGHDVTLIAAHKPKETVHNGTLRYIHLTGFYEEYDTFIEEFDPWNVKEESHMFESKDFMDLVGKIWDRTFEIPEVKSLLKSNETFDALILEDTWTDCFKILGQIFNCPVIVFTSFGGNNPFLNAAVGNPLPPSYIPHFYKFGPHFNGMNFFHRVHNFIFYMVEALILHFYQFPIHNQILKKHFDNPDDIANFYNNISLVLLGSHSSLRQAGPLLPNIVEIGGFHIDPPKKLPKDLQEFLDGATDGAIYFSLGSHISSKDMPKTLKKNFLKVFGKLKQKVLWKFEDDLPDKPDNVLIKKWLPQRDILAHPNIKFFITHAGHGSTLEAVSRGVPCIMIPLCFDQYSLAYQAVEKGYALKITYREATESSLMKAMVELLKNPKYRNNAKKVQHLFHDRPMKPVDTVLYWIEYVIRHKGADHLKIVGLNMPWYQFYSVDVIVFLLGSLFTVLYLCYLLFRIFLCPNNRIVKQKQKIY